MLVTTLLQHCLVICASQIDLDTKYSQMQPICSSRSPVGRFVSNCSIPKRMSARTGSAISLIAVGGRFPLKWNIISNVTQLHTNRFVSFWCSPHMGFPFLLAPLVLFWRELDNLCVFPMVIWGWTHLGALWVCICVPGPQNPYLCWRHWSLN